MKPKPLSALNHFTVPVAISSNPSSVVPRRDLAAPTVSLPVLGSRNEPESRTWSSHSTRGPRRLRGDAEREGGSGRASGWKGDLVAADTGRREDRDDDRVARPRGRSGRSFRIAPEDLFPRLRCSAGIPMTLLGDYS